MVLFAGFPKKCKHHEQLTHTNMQQLRMQRKQNRRYRNYAAAKVAPAIPQLCSRESSTCDTAIMQQRLMPLPAYPEQSSGVLFVGC